jgi:hypothetical protein
VSERELHEIPALHGKARVRIRRPYLILIKSSKNAVSEKVKEKPQSIIDEVKLEDLTKEQVSNMLFSDYLNLYLPYTRKRNKKIEDVTYAGYACSIRAIEPYFSKKRIKLKDLTDSIVPGNLKPQENIVTGVINLTPPTDKNPNGNIECAIIPHRTNANGTTTPTKIYNVINAQEEREMGKYSATLTPSTISQSNQPLTGLKPQKYLSIDDMQA